MLRSARLARKRRIDEAESGAATSRSGADAGDRRWRRRERLIALRLDFDVIERFRATGPGWQSRINMIVREYLEKK